MRPRPRPLYAFARRLDRRRVALRLAKGMELEQVAAVERAAPSEVERLLGDESFASLVAHHRAVASLSYAERIGRLLGEALELLELALAAGDVRVALFVAREIRAGRDPARSLAEAVLRAQARLVEAPAPVPRERARPRPLSQPRRVEADFPYCAATAPDEAAALSMLDAETPRLDARIAGTERGLAARLANEDERVGTAVAPDAPARELRRVVAARHADSAGSMRAAMRLEERKAVAQEWAAKVKAGWQCHPVGGGYDTS